jgi:hypothetical protein
MASRPSAYAARQQSRVRDFASRNAEAIDMSDRHQTVEGDDQASGSDPDSCRAARHHQSAGRDGQAGPGSRQISRQKDADVYVADDRRQHT